MGSIIFGYKISSAAVSGQKPGSPIDVGVFPISGHNSPPNCIGALACCMYKWSNIKNQWVPYT
jgi:hypothetical protein